MLYSDDDVALKRKVSRSCIDNVDSKEKKSLKDKYVVSALLSSLLR